MNESRTTFIFIVTCLTLSTNYAVFVRFIFQVQISKEKSFNLAQTLEGSTIDIVG